MRREFVDGRIVAGPDEQLVVLSLSLFCGLCRRRHMPGVRWGKVPGEEELISRCVPWIHNFRGGPPHMACPGGLGKACAWANLLKNEPPV